MRLTGPRAVTGAAILTSQPAMCPATDRHHAPRIQPLVRTPCQLREPGPTRPDLSHPLRIVSAMADNIHDSLTSYRDHLVLARQKAVEDADKTVLSLSGGALGVSFAFLNDVAGPNPMALPLLVTAWSMWGISIVVVLTSYFFSFKTLTKTIAQVDADTVYKEKPGGWFAPATIVCNLLGGVSFALGVLFIGLFVANNMKG